MEKEQFNLNISSEKAYEIAKSNIKVGLVLNLGLISPVGYFHTNKIIFYFRSIYLRTTRGLYSKTVLDFIPINENSCNIIVSRTEISFYRKLWLTIACISFVVFGLLVFFINTDYSIVINGVRRQVSGHPYFLLTVPVAISLITFGIIPIMESLRNKSVSFFNSLYGSYIK